jgi:hypothetical protein
VRESKRVKCLSSNKQSLLKPFEVRFRTKLESVCHTHLGTKSCGIVPFFSFHF